MFRKRKRKMTYADQEWFDELDSESQQETCIRYLRSLDATSLNNLYKAVDAYRQGDKILGRVKDPEVEKRKQLGEDDSELEVSEE